MDKYKYKIDDKVEHKVYETDAMWKTGKIVHICEPNVRGWKNKWVTVELSDDAYDLDFHPLHFRRIRPIK